MTAMQLGGKVTYEDCMDVHAQVMDFFATPAEYAALTGTGFRTVMRKIAANELRVLRVGREVFIWAGDIGAPAKPKKALTLVPSTPPGKAERSPRGHRLPPDWMPMQKTIDTIKSEIPGVTDAQLRAEHRKFTDYWLAAAGQKGVKKDWEATWRNWMRSAAERGQLGGAPRRRTNADKVSEWMNMEVDGGESE